MEPGEWINAILGHPNISLVISFLTLVVAILALIVAIAASKFLRDKLIIMFDFLVRKPILLAWKNKYSSLVTLLLICSLVHIYQSMFKIPDTTNDDDLTWDIDDNSYYSAGVPDIPAWHLSNPDTHILYIDSSVKKHLNQIKKSIKFINNKVRHIEPCAHTWTISRYGSSMRWDLSGENSSIADTCEQGIILSLE